MPNVGIKTEAPILNEKLASTSNDPEVVFNLFINRLIGPNKKSSYGKFSFRSLIRKSLF